MVSKIELQFSFSSTGNIAHIVEVRNSLIREAKRLTDLWDAQVSDLDSQIAQSIAALQKRQTQVCVVCFVVQKGSGIARQVRVAH